MRSRLRSLAILQLEQYDTKRFLANNNVINEAVVARIKWTPRLKVTKTLSYLVGIVGANTLISWPIYLYEKWLWYNTRKMIKHLKKMGLKVVAIAGSYGKTSVKHYGRELLRQRYNVVATPESYNTVMGIAKCLEYEVDAKTEIFLVEVGAYKIGDIAYLLEMLEPDCGILTGMARQHLERFGSWKNIVKAKAEIAEYIKAHEGVLIANKSDRAVVAAVTKLGINPRWYGGANRHEINLAAALSLAEWAGLDKKNLNLKKVREPKNRFEMTTDRYGMAVIDDSFSSNDVGFVDAIIYLGKQTKYTRILVTPGLVELGMESDKIHEQLGKGVIGNADYVILVGKNDRTRSMEKGIGIGIPIIYVEKTLDFMQAVKNLNLKKDPLVLLENDVTENY